ncbi:MAG TPA: hypothetical protein VGM10_18375 [Actinocrinis sp.]|jgi:hypothetical protein
MSVRGEWASLRDSRMTTPETRAGYEAEKRAHELGEAFRQLRTELSGAKNAPVQDVVSPTEG